MMAYYLGTDKYKKYIFRICMGQNLKLLSNVDVSNTSHILGNFKLFRTDNKRDYETFIILALPSNQKDFKEGNFEVSYKGNTVKVDISKIDDKDQDPIFIVVNSLQPLVSFRPEIILPPEIYTDNRGSYPYYRAIIHFPFCLADWFDQDTPTGIKNIDNERAQITGGYKHESKIDALTVLNKLFLSEDYDLKKQLVYDDVTLFIENYFSKRYHQFILQRVNIFTSKNAYKNSIEYFFGSFGEERICEIIRKRNIPDIKTENDLSDYILYVIKDLIMHEVENRNWTDAFWNSERKVKRDNGEDIPIPAEPKKETEIQSTLHVFFRLVLDDLGIQVDREPSVGIGNVDFKFTYATKSESKINTLLEFKLAHHQKIKHGLTKQLPAYLKADRSTCGIFAIMWFKDDKGKFFKEPANRTKVQMLEFITETSKYVSERDELNIKAVLIDASIKQTASNI
jgi:hypothetical protein